MKIWNGQDIRNRINEILPEGKCVPLHTERGHFYAVPGEMPAGIASYPSVTGKLQILKDEGLINYKMNRVIDYVFAHFKEFTDANIMDQLDSASKVPAEILADAGDIGTRIHNYREAIFSDWIKTGKRPENFLSYIPADEEDIRATSALRALQSFCVEKDYIPVACELLLYNHELKVAGTLDDLGLLRKVIRASEDPTCDHYAQIISNDKTSKHTCIKCNYQYRYEFVLMDLKTSNQFKDHYFFQVALYRWMFWKLMGSKYKPEKCFILKVSKEDGRYKIEDLKQSAKLAQYAKYMIKTNEGVDFIKSLRKDNQKTVIKI